MTCSRLPTEMSFSDFYPSELSDITSSDEDDEFVPNSLKRSTANRSKRDHQPYTIPNPLRPPRSTSYSVRALYGPSFLPFSPLPAHSSIRTNHRWIDRLGSRLSKRYAYLSSCSPNVPLHPRLADVVWSEQKQIGLIDSVFRNYYIPPIIFGEPSISTPSLIKPLKSPQ